MYKTIFSKQRLLAARLGLVATFCFLSGQQAHAQAVLEEVIVTAQKREQSAQDVGISITAFSEARMQALNLNNSNEIVYLTPGLSLANPGGEGNITSLSMRGIGQGDYQDIQESPVASYSDEVYDAYMGATNTALFDLERVEVLRGPQGTLFGRNATGGLVHYISQKPSEAFSTNLNLSLGEESHVRFEAGVGGPFSDNLFGRLSVFSNKHDPYVENTSGKDGNEADTQAARGQLLFLPSEGLEILVMAATSKTDINQWNFEAASADFNAVGEAVLRDQPLTAGPGFPNKEWDDLADGDPFKVSRDADGNVAARGAAPIGLDRESSMGSLRVDWSLNDAMTLTSITAHIEHEKLFNQESDGTPEAIVFFGTDTDTEQFSQELRLAGQTDRMHWVTGAYYLDYEVESFLDVDFFSPNVFITESKVQTDSWSVFGQVDYDFGNDWSVIAGLRYIDEEKELESTGSQFGGASVTINPKVSPHAKIDDDGFAGKLQFNWRADEDWMLYAGISYGYKASAFNGPFGAPDPDAATNIFDAETPITYEGGFKSSLFDGRMQWNASAYYYDYKDFQAFYYEATNPRIFNTDAEVKGIDSELTISPLDGLHVLLGVNLMDTTVDDVRSFDSTGFGGSSKGVVEDRTLPYAPDVQVTGLVRYSWSAWNGTLTAQGDVNYQTKTHFEIVNSPAATIDSYTMGNVRLSYDSSDGGWGVAAFVKNVTDKEYITSISNNASFELLQGAFMQGNGLGQVQRFYGRPRWAGVQFTYNID